MSHTLFLVQWDPAAAAERGVELQAAGWTVYVERNEANAVRRIRQIKPDVVVVDLTERPEVGRSIAQSLRATEATRAIPLLAITATGQAEPLGEGTEGGDVAYTRPEGLVEALARYGG
jgi:DNA-binding response OmpR family regulator